MMWWYIANCPVDSTSTPRWANIIPDWAVAFREDSVKHVYFVAETKGNDIEVSQLRRAEDAKIECARRHFAAISTGDVVYSVGENLSGFV